MVECNKVNVKLSVSLLNKLKSVVKNQTGVTSRMSMKIFNANNLPHELLLTTRPKTKLRNAFESNISTDIKLSKAQTSKIVQSGGFLGALLSIIASPPIGSSTSNWKNILALLGITAAALEIDAGIQKKIHASGITTLLISNEVINYIIKIVQILQI